MSILEPLELRNITFKSDVTAAELGALVGALREPPPDIDDQHWPKFVQEQGFSGLVFNEPQYEPGVVEMIEKLVGPSGGDGEGARVESLEERVQAFTGRPAEALRAELPRFGRELLVRGEVELFGRMLAKICQDFQSLEPEPRVLTVRACAALLDSLTLALRHRCLEASADFLLQVLSEETSDRVLHELTPLLHHMAASAVQLADYDLATRVFTAVSDRRKALECNPGDETQKLAQILSRELDPAVGQVLEEDLVSGDAGRQEQAARVLGSLGMVATPLLVEVIKRERSFRIRQIAARLLGDVGPRAARHLKREVLLEIMPEQRFRILEILDAVTDRVRDELAFCLGDRSSKIRHAACRLAERVGDPAFVEVVAPHAQNDDLDIARGAIRCLATLGSEEAALVLVEALKTPKENDHVIACVQALGRIGHPIAVDALSRLLRDKKRLLAGLRWDEQVRATAAMALSQIDDPEAKKVLAGVQADPQPKVRQMARTAAGVVG